ncbi:MAG: hypothetical protein CR988_03430 [Treponema sp.]|nr:MAG: hypothetical protein CR988_03430 [Treponema sp.]
MKPEKLTLCNIGPFVGKHSVDFSRFNSIFLVWGNTGSGKTTIFDAISYAFYGKPPGIRSQSPKNMRSHLVADTEPSEVELIFSIKNKRYKILRSLPVYSNKKNKETPEGVELWEYNTTVEKDWKNISESKKTDTAKKIENLIKLSFDKFSKIVVLPQGQFADFLSKTSNQRQNILENLFPVDQYTKIMEKAKVRQDNITEKISYLQEELNRLQETYNDSLYSTAHKELNDEINRLKKDLKEINKKLDLKKEEKIQAGLILERKKKYAKAKEQLEDTNKKIEDYNQKKMQIEMARKAEPLAVEVEQIEELIRNEKSESDKLYEIKNKQIFAQEKFNQYVEQKSTIEKEEKNRDNLLAKEDRLKRATELFNEIKKEKDKLSELHKKLLPKNKKLTELKQKLSDIKKEINLAQNDAELFSKHETEFNLVKEKSEYLQYIYDLIAKYNEKKQNFKTHNSLLQKKENKLEIINKNIKIEKEEYDFLEETKAKTEQQNIAFILVKQLKENYACPVCGSLTHPTPATRPEKLSFSIDERIEKSNASLENFLSEKKECEEEITKCKINTEQWQNQLNEIIQEAKNLNSKYSNEIIFSTPIDKININEVFEMKSTVIEELNDKSKLKESSLRSMDKKNKLEQSHDENTKLYEKINFETNEISIQESSLKSIIKEKENNFDKLFSEINENKENPSLILEKCQVEIKDISHKINSYYQNISEAEKALENFNTAKQMLEVNLADIKKQIREKTDEVELKCSNAGFAGFDDLKSAIIPSDEIKQNEDEIKKFYEYRAATLQSVETLKKELEGQPEYDYNLIETEVDQLNIKVEELEARAANKTTQILELENKHNQYLTLFNKHKETCENSIVINKLANKLNGKNSKKLKFDTWILSYFFKQITVYANKRLEKMSNGRYRLVVTSENETKKGFDGLNLQIADANTGKLRPSSTLSGGETFMASISLALGFADSITANAGGIVLDSMFIDEGFGTLDSTCLENAISILDEVRGHRMVGIISHVAELTSRIPEKIKIEKTNHGSKIMQ